MPKQIPLTQGKFALVDDADFEWLRQWRWRYFHAGNGYAGRQVKGDGKATNILMHRLILDCPKGMEIDHIDHDGLNNQRANLRLATHAENMRNRSLHKNNSSGFTGVRFQPENNLHRPWRAAIKIDGKTKHLGMFASPEDAHEAWKKAAVAVFGAFAPLEL